MGIKSFHLIKENTIIFHEKIKKSLSLDIKPDVPKDQIIELYEQANVEITDLITKKVEDVEFLHNVKKLLTIIQFLIYNYL